MSKKERIKENIATFRAGIMLLITSLFGVFGYAVINIDTLDTIRMLIGTMICVILVVGLVIVIKLYLKLVDELEKLE